MNSKAKVMVLLAPALLAGWLASAAEVRGGGDAARRTPGPREAFLEKCSRCHEPERGYSVLGDRAAWMMTVARMGVKDRSWISPPGVKRIIAYQSSWRRSQSALFGRVCGGCHLQAELDLLDHTPTQWRTWVNFMSGRSGAEITPEESELLVFGLKQRT